MNWISVKDRLPEAEKEVLLLCKTTWRSGHTYCCIAVYVPEGILRGESCFNWDYECCDEYCEEHDDYYVNAGWYERIYNWDDYAVVGIDDKVTHWAYLPEPPKEETNDKKQPEEAPGE